MNRRSQFKRGIDHVGKLKKRHDDMLSVRRNNRIDKLVTLRYGDKPIPMERYNEMNSDIQSWLPKLYGQTFEEVYDSVTCFRKFLSTGLPDAIKMAINAGIVPRLVQLCEQFNYPNLQFEAVWAITNIASGSNEETQTVVSAGAIPVLVKMMNSSDENVRKQSIWAIGNIIAESSNNRDLFVDAGAMPLLIKNLENPSDISMLQIASWTCSKFASGKVKLNYSVIAPVLPCLDRLLCMDDTEILCNVCWLLVYITDGCSLGIDDVIRLGYHKRLANLLSHPESFVKVPALRAIGNIAAGSNVQTDAIVGLGVVQSISILTRSPIKKIRKDAVWTLSNIAAGTPQQIQTIIESVAIPNVIYLLRYDKAEIKKEAIYVIYNYCFNATNEQMVNLIDPVMINSVSNMLKSDDVATVMIALNTIDRVLSGGQPYINMFIEADGINKIYTLHQCPNKDVFDKAKSIYERLINSPKIHE